MIKAGRVRASGPANTQLRVCPYAKSRNLNPMNQHSLIRNWFGCSRQFQHRHPPRPHLIVFVSANIKMCCAGDRGSTAGRRLFFCAKGKGAPHLQCGSASSGAICSAGIGKPRAAAACDRTRLIAPMSVLKVTGPAPALDQACPIRTSLVRSSAAIWIDPNSRCSTTHVAAMNRRGGLPTALMPLTCNSQKAVNFVSWPSRALTGVSLRIVESSAKRDHGAHSRARERPC